MILHNPTYGVVTQLRIMFVFSRSGGIFPSLTCDSIRLSDPVNHLYNVPVVISFVYYVLMTLYMLVSELGEIKDAAMSGDCVKAIKDYYCEPGGLWNLVDAFAIFMSFGNLVTYYLVYASSDAFNTEMERFVEGGLGADQQAGLYKALDDAVSANANFCTGLVLFAVAVVLRLFKNFSAQPRLAVVVECLRQSAVDVFHFFVVFLTIFALWSIIGLVLFGHSTQGFADFSGAFLTCLYLIMGEMDLEAMEAAGGRLRAELIGAVDP